MENRKQSIEPRDVVLITFVLEISSFIFGLIISEHLLPCGYR